MDENDFAESSRWCFAAHAPTVNTEACLNRLHRAAACTRCAAACPVQAIALAEGEPVLDCAQCVRCGVCEVACPTDVFAQPHKVEDKLVQTVVQTPSSVALRCPVHTEPEYTSAPVDVVVRHKRCLAALSISELLAMTQPETREIWLDDNACATCPLSVAQQTLRASVASAQTLLQAVEAPARLELCSDHPELGAVKPVARPLLDGSQPKIARRRLFSFGVRATQDPHQVEGVPLSHQQLLAQLRRISGKDEAKTAATPVPFTKVQVDERACSACALCAHFCPTAALQFEVTEQEFTIDFWADCCIGCTLCQIACPEDAISVSDSIPLGDLLTHDVQTLVAGESAPCVQCGAVTAVRDGVALCHSCRHGAGPVTSLRDGAGLMADLLSRIGL